MAQRFMQRIRGVAKPLRVDAVHAFAQGHAIGQNAGATDAIKIDEVAFGPFALNLVDDGVTHVAGAAHLGCQHGGAREHGDG